MSEQYYGTRRVCPAWTLKPCLLNLKPERVLQIIERVCQCVACVYSPNGYDCMLSEPELSGVPTKDLRRRVLVNNQWRLPMEAIV